MILLSHHWAAISNSHKLMKVRFAHFICSLMFCSIVSADSKVGDMAEKKKIMEWKAAGSSKRLREEGGNLPFQAIISVTQLHQALTPNLILTHMIQSPFQSLTYEYLRSWWRVCIYNHNTVFQKQYICVSLHLIFSFAVSLKLLQNINCKKNQSKLKGTEDKKMINVAEEINE